MRKARRVEPGIRGSKNKKRVKQNTRQLSRVFLEV
jgi:hypothetical protein